MATRDEITAQIRENLNDSGYYYIDEDIHNSIQDGYDEIVASTGCIEKAVEIPFVANQPYYDLRTLIPDFLGLIGIYNRTVKRWMIPVSVRELDKIRENWETANGEPYLFWPVNYRFLAIFPTPANVTSANKMYLFYKAAADTLLPSSEPIIPYNNQECTLRAYGTSDLFEQAEEWNKSELYRQIYLTEVEQIKTWVADRDKERMHRLGGSL